MSLLGAMQPIDDNEIQFAKLLSERYSNPRKVGEGGNGIIFKAFDKNLSKFVAIKVLNTEASPEVVLRFQTEAKAAGRLHHENVVRVLDFGAMSDGSLYLVMEFIEGVNLHDLLDSHGVFSSEETVPLFLQIAEGMVHAHSLGILHRDLKPRNVIVDGFNTDSCSVKVVDFGLAVIVGSRQEITKGGIMGTPPYMAPEQDDRMKVGDRSDIYAFGCLMIECLTGDPPFTGDSAMEICLAHKAEPAPRLQDRLEKGSYPEALELLIDKCLKKDPDERYQSMKEVVAELESIRDFQNRLRQERTRDKSIRKSTNQEVSLSAGFHISPVQEERRKNHNLLALSIVLVCLSVVILAVFGTNIVSLDTAPKKVEDVTTKKKESGVEFLDDFYKTNFAEREQGGLLWTVNKAPIQDADLMELSDRKDITRLWLRDCGVSGDGLKYLSGNAIVSLSFVKCTLSDSGLRNVRLFPSLVVLRLVDCPFLTDQGIKAVGKSETIRSLHINRCPQLTALSLETLKKLPSLKRLSLRDMEQFDHDCVSRLAKFTDLEVLNLSGTRFSGDDLTFLKNFSQLYALDLSSLPIVDSDLQYVCQPHLQALSLRSTRITPKGLAQLKSCKNLKYLDLRGCINLTRDHIDGFLKGLPSKPVLITNFNSQINLPVIEEDLMVFAPKGLPASNWNRLLQ